MTTPPAAATPPPRLVGSFIIGLNILRRQIGSYPPGHPAVGNAAEKVIRLLRHLLRDTESLTLTFSRDTVMWGLTPLERSNPVFRDYARALSSRGVAALSFSTATSPDDLLRLNRVLALRKEEIYAAGGVNALLQQEGSVHLDLQEIDYRQFRLIEGEREKKRNPETSMWENLVLSMFAEGDAGTTSELAANLNTYLEQNPSRRDDTYASVIAAFVRSMDSGASDGGAGNFAAKLAALATKLAPEIRHQFVATAFELLPEKSAEAEALFLAIPQEVIVAAIEEINLQKGGVPPVLLGLLGKLGAGVANDPAAASESQHSAAEMADKVRVLLRPEKFHHFVPDVYQGKLELLLAGDSVSGVSQEEAAELRNAFYGENSAVKTGDIVAEVVKTFPADNIMLSEPLEDLCLYLLEAGDLTSLLHVCRKIRETEEELDTRLFGPALPDALVHAVDSWGKERQAELKEIMRIVGEPVVEPLLERLSTENNMALRRHFIECIASIGPAARTTVLNRLGDNRWYVLRNLIIILRRFNDRADIVHIRPLLRHSHDKVRMEALRTLLDLRDREAEKSLAGEIQRGTKEVQLASIQMAEGSRSPEVIEALMRVVEKSGMNTDYEVRKLGVRILATTADVRALPVLDKLLNARSILRSSNAESLKMEIVRSLPSYPARAAAQLLGKVASAGLGEVSRTATSLLSVIREQTR